MSLHICINLRCDHCNHFGHPQVSVVEFRKIMSGEEFLLGDMKVKSSAVECADMSACHRRAYRNKLVDSKSIE